MSTSNVHEAKTNLSELLDAAERGEDVYITRRGGTVTRFALVPAPRTPRSPRCSATTELGERPGLAVLTADETFLAYGVTVLDARL